MGGVSVSAAPKYRTSETVMFDRFQCRILKVMSGDDHVHTYNVKCGGKRYYDVQESELRPRPNWGRAKVRPPLRSANPKASQPATSPSGKTKGVTRRRLMDRLLEDEHHGS